MIRQRHVETARQRAPRVIVAVLTLISLGVGVHQAQSLAERNGPLPPPLPLFPADNWWNQDVSQAPVDPRSASIITFIGGAGRGMHPDFGGYESPGSQNIYGMPYVVVGADQPKLAVEFDYADESDGVNHQTGQSYPFYPIPAQAITEPYWIEGGPPGNQNPGGDRHMLVVDRDNRHLYELFALRWTGSRWEAGSGAFFDLNTNARRPEGWTSADAAGLAILPGLVRYDEVFGPEEIRHALRVTVRGVNGYVWPASHRANTNVNGPPLGARLRLKPDVNISGYPAYIQKIFRAMKTHGLIVADTGSDMYVSGAFDPRWNNSQLNPAFRAIKASDFEVVELGWRGGGSSCVPPGAPTALDVATAGLRARFTWTPPATGGALSDYLLEAGSGPGLADLATVPVPGGATAYEATAAPGTYYVRVRARNACGSAVSNAVAVVLTSVCVLPQAPGQPVASVAGSAVTVTWPAATGASSHVFEAGLLPGQATLVNTVVSQPALAAQAPPGIYFVRARGRNACGTGPASPETMIPVGCAAPGPASPLSVAVNGRQVAFAWNAADNTTDYVLEAGSGAGLTNIASLPVGGAAMTVLAPPGTYHVRVRPRNACGSGLPSNEVVVTVS
jgi:hypothetical protein